MTSLLSANSFLEEKKQFFKPALNTLPAQDRINQVQKKVRSYDYEFLLKHRLSIEAEFRHLYRVLNDEEGTQEKDSWLYCYYCSMLLSEYYKDNHYNSPEKHAEYLKIAQSIEYHYTQGDFPKDQLRDWKTHLKADISELLSTPFHLSKIRSWLGFGNGYRIVFTFSRLTDQEFFLVLDKWADFLRKNLHLNLNLDEMNRKINGPTATFRALSVGLFAARFLVNLSLTIKHTFFPSPKEQEITASARFYEEIKKRYPQLLNDIVWATINGLTNYAEFFKISNPLAMTILVAGLSFDVSLLGYRLWEAKQDYDKKYEEYTQEAFSTESELRALTKNPTSENEAERLQLESRLRYILAQIKEHELSFGVLTANFEANIIAATLILSALPLSLFLAAPAAIGVCYLLIVVGTALYLSADHYSAYREKALRAEGELSLGENIPEQAQKEISQAWKGFVNAMVKNTLMPLFVMGALAFSWQAATLMLVLFVAHEYTVRYVKAHADYQEQIEQQTQDCCASPS